MDRRAFVKASLGAAGAATIGTGGILLARELVPSPGHAAVRYFGAQHVRGPAPRGVPYLPIGVREGAFFVKTRVALDGRDIDVLDWHRHCGRRDAPGLDPGAAQDDLLRYQAKEEHRFLTPWFKDLLGEPVRPEHFPGVGFGAAFTWRSQGAEGAQVLPGVLVRLDPAQLRRIPRPDPPAEALTDAEWDLLRREFFHGGFVAFSAVCTHFCCVAGWQEAEKLAKPRDAWDKLYCACHGATFDPRRAVAYRYERGADDPAVASA